MTRSEKLNIPDLTPGLSRGALRPCAVPGPNSLFFGGKLQVDDAQVQRVVAAAARHFGNHDFLCETLRTGWHAWLRLGLAC